jgi:type II secretory pathway predicted ATPase ExeA
MMTKRESPRSAADPRCHVELGAEDMERMLTLPMEHWGFDYWPFRSAGSVDQFYPTAGTTEALARIEYLVESRRRLGVLLGESGLGKSLLLQVAARQLEQRRRAIVSLSAMAISAREFLWNLAAGLNTGSEDDADVARLWRQVADRVVENRLQQVNTVLLVDDIGHAGPDLVTQLVRLSRLDLSPGARWTIVLTMEPVQAARWNSTLRDLVDLRIDLRAWSEEDTVGFVQTTLVDAGRLEPVFDDEALARLHELSAGVPRRVARLADFALLAAAAAGLHTIDAGAVEAAQDETAWPEPAAVF